MKKHPITDKVLTEKRFLLGLNTQSLRCHHHGFMVEVEIIDEKPKIIALTETWLTKIDKEPVIQSKRGKANTKSVTVRYVKLLTRLLVSYFAECYSRKSEKLSLRNLEVNRSTELGSC